MTDGISVGKDDIGAADVGFRIFHVAKTNIFVITKNDNMKKGRRVRLFFLGEFNEHRSVSVLG